MTLLFRTRQTLVLGALAALLSTPSLGWSAPSRRVPDPDVKCLDACHEAAVRALNELYMKEKYAEALQAWEALYESTPSPMLLTNIAGALYKLDRCEEALAAYRLLSR